MYLAIDIGGTKTLLALFSAKGRIMKKYKFPTNQDPEKFAKELNKNLLSFFPKRKTRIPVLNNVVVGIAATVDPNFSSISHPSAPTLASTVGKPLKYGNLPWQNFPFPLTAENCIKNLFKNNRVKRPTSAPHLSIHGTTTECCPIYIENDANLSAFYECHKLSGKSIFLTFSTGIGGGICKDGQLTPNSATFEPGHTKYTWQSRHTEYEDIASANALKLAYGTRVSGITGKLAYQDIALRVSTGLSDIIKTERPDHIIIGGAVAFQLRNFKKYLSPILSVSLSRSLSELPTITAAKSPLESVIHGCYLYGSQRD